MTASPQWFGDTERPLFGWVHRPAGEVRALVVVCPSMGQEAVFAHFTLRSLAEELAELGFVVVRFDYDGTGDSAGQGDDPDRAAAWLGSIDAAVALGRQHTDAPLALLGFRVGALLAVEAAARSGAAAVHGLALWDAPRSGRHYLRERVIQHNVSVGGADAGSQAGFTALGLTLTEQAQAELSALDLKQHAALPCEVAVVLDRSGRPGLTGVTTGDGGDVERIEAVDQDDLLLRQALPLHTQEQLVAWFGRTYPKAAHTLHPAPPERTAIDLPGATESVERVGPDGLFGLSLVPTRPASTTRVVFVPDSFTSHNGLGRVWTEVAREWAAQGIGSVRFDLAGCADSPVRDGVPPHTISQVAHIHDAVNALRHARPDDPSDTILIGLCSGAYLSVEAALEVVPRGMGLVNPVMSFIGAEPKPDRRRRAIILTRRLPRLLGARIGGRVAERLSKHTQIPAFMNDPNFKWNRTVEAGMWQVYLLGALPWLPDRVWRWVNGLLLTRRVDRVLGEVLDGGTDIALIAGDPDQERITVGAHAALDALVRQGRLRMVYDADIDHAIMRPGAKQVVAEVFSEFVAEVAGRSPVVPTARVDAASTPSAGGAPGGRAT